MNPDRALRNQKKVSVQNKSPKERVRAFRKLFGNDAKVLALINPDPDSMASVLAVKRLLWKRVSRISVAYIGEIKRLDNLAMKELLNIPMVEVAKIDPEDFTHFVLVDSQPNHSEIFESFTFDVIIDHHPKTKEWNVPYADIRTKYGANSTILTEYLRAAGIKPSMRLATALLYAIKTDTANFERSGIEEDVRQFRYLFQYANMNLLKKIEKSELRPSDLDYFQTALANRVITRKGIYTHLGKVSNPDIGVQVADFFTRVHGVGWVFVSGVYENKVIIIIRNDGYLKNAGKFASLTFGDIGSAGGHQGAARVEIPFDTLKQKGIKGSGSSLVKFIRKRLRF